MGKSEILKARVGEQTFRDFHAVCEAIGEAPARQLRRLVEGFISERIHRIEAPVQVHIYRPEGYDTGVARVRLTLRDPEALMYQRFAVTFRLPQLPARRVHADEGYGVGASDGRGGDLRTDGLFMEGVWQGHIYSNGCAEARNPTPLNEVAAALEAAVSERIEMLRS